MVFNATFNNISVISWRSVLFVDETGVPGENHKVRNKYHDTCEVLNIRTRICCIKSIATDTLYILQFNKKYKNKNNTINILHKC